jgi:hypothetical protein
VINCHINNEDNILSKILLHPGDVAISRPEYSVHQSEFEVDFTIKENRVFDLDITFFFHDLKRPNIHNA